MTTERIGTPETVSIDELSPYHENPRRGDVSAIAESLRINGQFRPLVVNRGTHTGRPNEVLAGNHTLAAALSLDGSAHEIRHLDCYMVDVDDDAAVRIVLADNRTSDLAAYDDHALADLLQTMDDLEGTAYADDDLEALLSATSDAVDMLTSFPDDDEDDDDEDEGDTPERIEYTPEPPGHGKEYAPEDSLLVLNFSVTADDRHMIRTALAAVRKTHDLVSISDALVHVVSTHPEIDLDQIAKDYEAAVNAPIEGDNVPRETA